MASISIPKIDKASRIALQKLSKRLNYDTSPIFAGLTLTGLTANSLIYPASGGVLTSLGAATNGQLPIGSTGAAPVLAGITGTANQITVTNGAGSITLSTPQNIHTAATPTFADLTLSAPSNIYALNHDSFAGFVADEHVAHTGVSILAGTGMSGGGDISASRTLNCTITQYTDEMVDDRVAALIQNGTGLSWTYNDVANTLTGNVSITQYTDELAQDAVGGMVANTATINLTYTDLTPSLTADLNSTLKTNYDAAYTHSGLVTGNPHNVTKTEVGLGSVENTALSTWAGTTNITTLGTIATGVWNGTDIAIADGGTGQSTAQAAIDALTAVAGATNEHVLTKDTATGNAIWKAATGGGGNAFGTITGITNDVVADAASDTLTLASANSKLTIVGTALTDTVTFTVVEGQIAHDNLSGYSANKHVDHTAVTLTAGVGMTGGGDISANRTFDVSLDNGEDSLSDDFNITADTTWQTIVKASTARVGVTLPAAGTYLVFFGVGGLMKFSAGADELIQMRLYNQTDAAAVTPPTTRPVVQGAATGVQYEGYAASFAIITVAASKEIVIQLYRTAATWTFSQCPQSAKIVYMRIA